MALLYHLTLAVFFLFCFDFLHCHWENSLTIHCTSGYNFFNNNQYNHIGNCSKCMNEIHVKFVFGFFFPAYTFEATWWCPYYMTSIAKSGIVTERHTNRLSCLCICASRVHLMSSDSTHPQQRQQALPLGSPSLRSLTHSLCALMEGRAATVCVILSVTLASGNACSADRAAVLKVHIWFSVTAVSCLPADLLLVSSAVAGRVEYI